MSSERSSHEKDEAGSLANTPGHVNNIERKNINSAVAFGQQQETVNVSPNLTVITSHNPQHLTKRVYLEPDGTVKKEPIANLVDGSYEKKHMEKPSDLKALIMSLQSNQAIMPGVPKDAPATGQIMATSCLQPGAIARTLEYFKYPSDVAWFPIDIDPSDAPGAPQTDWDTVLSALGSVIEGFNDAPALLMYSSTAHIYHGDKCVSGEPGKRIYIKAKSGADIQELGRRLADRSNLECGTLWYFVTAAGTLNEKGLIDKAIYSPERLDFCVSAICDAPLVSQRGDSSVWNNDAPPLDLDKAIKPLTPAERRKLDAMRKKRKADVEPERLKKRDTWVEAQLAKHGSTVRDQVEYRQLLENATESYNLPPDFMVSLGNGTEVSCRDIMKDPGLHNRLCCRDPFEPDYDGGRNVGIVFTDGVRPIIYSHAHGGQTYCLQEDRITIELRNGRMQDAVEGCMNYLAARPDIFIRNEQLVLVKEGHMAMYDTPGKMEVLLDTVFRFVRFNKKGEEYPVDCPERFAKRMLHSLRLNRFRELRLITRYATMRLDGRLIMSPGYDDESGILYEPLPGADAHVIPDKPTREEIESAAAFLVAPYREYPFNTEGDLAAHIACVLTNTVRPVLPSTPAFLYTSPVQGTGKTKAATSAGLHSGEDQTQLPWPSNDEKEQRNVLATYLHSGSSTLLFDNVEGYVSGAFLASCLTSPKCSVRKMCTQDSIELSTRATIMFTGNNIACAKDMIRRSVVCRIDANEDRPELREFDFDPVAMVRDNIGAYRAAALTLLRAHANSGRPVITKPQLGSFEDWDVIVRQCVLWLNSTGVLDIGDPLSTANECRAVDPDIDLRSQLIAAWFNIYGDRLVTVKELLHMCTKGGSINPDGETKPALMALKDAVSAVADDGKGNLNARKLGWWLSGNVDCVAGDLKLVRSDTKATGGAWPYRVVTVSGSTG